MNTLAEAALPPDVMIARFKGDREAAVSLTFDDALRTHIEHAVPILDTYDLKGTFYVFTDNIFAEGVSTWEAWAQVAESGHEVGSHSKVHLALPNILDPRQLDDEIAGSADLIEARLGIRPLTFAYPFSEFTDAIRRQVLDTYLFDRADCRSWGGTGFSVEDGIGHLQQALMRKDWFYCMMHGVGEPSWEPIEPDVLEGLAAYLSENRDRFWVDTYLKVAVYERMRNTAVIAIKDVTPDSFVFRVNLPPGDRFAALPPQPLTVKIALEARDWKRVRGECDGLPLDVALSRNGYYLLTDVVPDGRWINIFWN